MNSCPVSCEGLYADTEIEIDTGIINEDLKKINDEYKNYKRKFLKRFKFDSSNSSSNFCKFLNIFSKQKLKKDLS